MNKVFSILAFFLLMFMTACLQDDPMTRAEEHLKQKVTYLQDKAKILKSPELKITSIHSIFPKDKPMPEPWAAMITFTMIHSEANNEVMRENFRVIFEFEDPYWKPAKLESDQVWNKGGNRVPLRELTPEKDKDAWTMINSILGLSGP